MIGKKAEERVLRFFATHGFTVECLPEAPFLERMEMPIRYSPEVRERAVRLVFEHCEEYESQWAAIREDRPLCRDSTQLGSAGRAGRTQAMSSPENPGRFRWYAFVVLILMVGMLVPGCSDKPFYTLQEFKNGVTVHVEFDDGVVCFVTLAVETEGVDVHDFNDLFWRSKKRIEQTSFGKVVWRAQDTDEYLFEEDLQAQLEKGPLQVQK